MEDCFGQQGWREFSQNRINILTDYDRALVQNINRPVRTSHGKVLEASIRKWLSEFLPKKYSVTSGYIISDLNFSNDKLYHYDVIVYNHLEAPILWVEGDSDMSNQGKFRAIPARYVISVFEIKSRFNSSNIIATKLKLSELLNIKDQLDDKFSSGVIFAELKEIDNNDKNALHKLSELTSVPGFIGGIILRYEKDSHITGLVSRIKREDDKNNGNTDSKRVTPLARPLSDIELYKNEDGNITLAGGIKGAGTKIMIIGENTWAMGKQYFVDIESGDKSINIAWSKSGFADFSHRLLNALEGMPIMSENYPLFGQIFDNVNFRPAPLQPPTAIEGKPFIDVELEDINGEKKEIFSKEKKSGIKYILKLNNISKHDVTFIKEEFYDTLEVKGGRSDNREYNIIMKEKKSIEDIIEILKKSPVEIKHRLVYKDIEGSYFAVECLIKIGDKIDLKILNEEDLANFHKKNT